LVHSGVAVAVPLGQPVPNIASEHALRQAVLAAPSVSLSTGPSGVQLRQLFERWGILHQIETKLVQAKPGVPVGALLARGEVALGFQQLSEMRGVTGIQVLGPLPPQVQITTTFSGSVASSCTQPQAVQEMLAFWASPECSPCKVLHGMAAIE
jgi:molybdate transport system substrate-binding protein